MGLVPVHGVYASRPRRRCPCHPDVVERRRPRRPAAAGHGTHRQGGRAGGYRQLRDHQVPGDQRGRRRVPAARRQHRAMEFLSCIERLSDLGYDKNEISKKTGLAPVYIQGIITLLKNGEERLLYAVEQKKIPLSIALKITTTANNNVEMQEALQDAYESGELKGHQLLQAKKVLERRQLVGKNLSHTPHSKTSKISAHDVVKTYQKEVERQHNFIKRATHIQERLTFIIGALSYLRKDENFFNLLRAESLDNLPQYLDEQLSS